MPASDINTSPITTLSFVSIGVVTFQVVTLRFSDQSSVSD